MGGEGGGAGAPAEGPKGGGPQKTFYKAPTDFTKPQRTIEGPDRLYKAPTDYTNPQQTIETYKILDKTQKY